MLNFVPSIGVNLNTQVLSNIQSVTVSQTLTVQGGSLVVNGLNVGSSGLVHNGDQLEVAITSSEHYSTAVHAVVSTDLTPDLYTYFAVTKNSEIPIVFPQLEYLLPLDLTQYANGSPYTPSIDSNSYSIYSDTGIWSSTVDFDAVASSTANDSYYIVADYHANAVYKFGIDNVLQQKLTITKPYGGASTIDAASVAGDALVWISLPEENKVIALSVVDLTTVHEFLVGEKPLGVASYNSGEPNSKLVICSSGNNRIIVVDSNTGIVEATINTPGKPFEPVVFGSKVFVTLSDQALLAVVDLTTYDLTLVSLPEPGLGITATVDSVVVACRDYISKVNASTLLETSTQFPGSYFYALVATADKIFATDTENNSVKVLNHSLVQQSFFSVEPTPYAVLSSGTQVIVCSMYSNAPKLMLLVDSTPGQFDVLDTAYLPRNVQIVTNEVQVTSVYPGVPIPVSVPNILGAHILKNDVDSGIYTDAVEGDILKVSFLSPADQGVSVTIPLVVGVVYEYFTSTTAFEDATPTPFTFNDLVSQVPASPLLSNTVSILGVDADATVVISSTPGSILYKNGVTLGTNFGVFALNDTLRVLMNAPSSNCGVTHAVVTAGNYVTVWTVTSQPQSGKFLLPAFVDKDFLQIPTIGAADTTSNALLFINESLTTVATTPLTNPTNSLSQKTYLNVLDKSKNSIYIIDPDTHVVAKTYVPPVGATIESIDYYPKYSEDSAIPTRLLIALSGPNKVLILGEDYEVITDYLLDFKPYSLMCDVNSQLFVAYKEQNSVEKFSVIADVIVPITDFQYDSPDFLSADPLIEGRFLVGSSNTQKLTVFNSLLEEVSTLEGIVAQGVESNEPGVGYIADSYYNSVRIVDDSYTETSRISASGPVSAIALIGQALHYSNLYNNTVYKYDTVTLVTTQTVLSRSLLGMAKYNTTLLVLRALTNLNVEVATSDLTQMDSVSIPFADNVPVGSTVQSTDLEVSGLLRPVVFYVEPYPGVELLKNDEVVVGHNVIVFNGDQMSVRLVAPTDYYTQWDVMVGSCSVSSMYSVRTEPDLLPDQVYFVTLYDQYLNALALSNDVVISGITDGFSSEITVDFQDTTGAYYINDEIFFTPTAIVTNGDVLRVAVLVDGPVGAIHNYSLNRLTTSFGTFKVVTITLDGAIIWPDFERRRVYAVPEVLEKVHVLSGVVSHDLHFSEPKLSYLEEPTPLKNSVSYVVLPELNALLDSNVTLVAESAVSIDSGITLSFSPRFEELVAPGQFKYTQVTDDLSSGEKTLVNTTIATDLSSGEKTLVNTSIKAPLPYTGGVLIEQNYYFTELPSEEVIVRTLVAQTDFYSFGSSIVYEIKVKEQPVHTHFNFMTVPIDQFFMVRPSHSDFLFVPIFNTIVYHLRDKEQPVHTHFNFMTVPIGVVFARNSIHDVGYYIVTADDIRYEIKEKETPEVILLRLPSHSAPYRPPVGLTYSYGVHLHTTYPEFSNLIGSREVDTFQVLFHPSSDKEASLGMAENYGRSIVLSTGVVALLVKNLSVLRIESPDYARRIASIQVWNAHQAELVQDIVTFCPPYGTCELKGLYSNQTDAFNAALNSGYSDVDEEAVPFKGCYLWTIEPSNFVLKYCASVGPDDLYIIPYAWNLSSGPLMIAKTQLKVHHYMHGG